MALENPNSPLWNAPILQNYLKDNNMTKEQYVQQNAEKLRQDAENVQQQYAGRQQQSGTLQAPTYGWTQTNPTPDPIDYAIDFGTLVGNNIIHAGNQLARGIDSYNRLTEVSPNDDLGLMTALGYEYNPDPKKVDASKKKIAQNRAESDAISEMNSQMRQDYITSDFKRSNDYSVDTALENAEKTSDKAKDENANMSTDDESQPTSVNNNVQATVSDVNYSPSDLSFSQIFDKWYSSPGIADAYDGYGSLPELMGSGNAKAVYDYQRFANQNYGRYQDLNDFFTYDDAVENAAQMAFDNYVEHYFNPTTAELNLSDLAQNTANAARILGTYAGDRDAYLDFFTNYNYGSEDSPAYYKDAYWLARPEELGNYSWVGTDDGGGYFVSNALDSSGTTAPLISPTDEDYYTMVEQMWTARMLEEGLRRNEETGLPGMTEDQMTQLLQFYPELSDTDRYEAPINYGTMGAAIPESDLSYTAAGVDTLTPEMMTALQDVNLSDLGLYYNNPDFMPIYAQVLASQAGYGSNLADYNEEELKRFAEITGINQLEKEEEKQAEESKKSA